MCCIFTCCGWIIDLVQRFWTFTMSCCISSAVCCALVTASMSGVALGYNYSLAEYIELKETNVSVYLKRGVFDDEVADEMDWRRSGGGPPARKGPEPEYQPSQPFALRRAIDTTPMATDEDMPIRYGRRMDDSIFQSNENHKYEGSLLKLTAYDLAATSKPTLPGLTLDVKEFPGADDSKAMVGVWNRRRMGDASTSTTKVIAIPEEYDGVKNYEGPIGRRNMITVGDDLPGVTTVPSLRHLIPYTIPESRVRPEWAFEGTPEVMTPRDPFSDPPPETVQNILAKLLKRNKVKTIGQTNVKTTAPPEQTTTIRSIAGFRADNINESDIPKTRFQQSDDEQLQNNNEKENKDYSEDDIKGLPIRKRRQKRNIQYSDTDTSSPTLTTTIKLDIERSEKEIISTVGEKQNENKDNNLLHKLISVFVDAKSIFSLAQVIKFESTNSIVLNSTNKTSGPSKNSEPKLLNTESIFKVTLPNIYSRLNNSMLLKIIKSTTVS